MSIPVELFPVFSSTDANAPATHGATMTGTAVNYSKMWSGSNRVQDSVELFWTGTPTGTFILQKSDKPNPDETTDNDWFTDTAATFTSQPAGSAGTSTTASSIVGYRRRVKYTNASGVGVLTGFAHSPRNA